MTRLDGERGLSLSMFVVHFSITRFSCLLLCCCAPKACVLLLFLLKNRKQLNLLLTLNLCNTFARVVYAAHSTSKSHILSTLTHKHAHTRVCTRPHSYGCMHKKNYSCLCACKNTTDTLASRPKENKYNAGKVFYIRRIQQR